MPRRRFQSPGVILQITFPLLIVLFMVYFSLVLSRFVITGKLSPYVYWENPILNAGRELERSRREPK
jgi:hypothetical protein